MGSEMCIRDSSDGDGDDISFKAATAPAPLANTDLASSAPAPMLAPDPSTNPVPEIRQPVIEQSSDSLFGSDSSNQEKKESVLSDDLFTAPETKKNSDSSSVAPPNNTGGGGLFGDTDDDDDLFGSVQKAKSKGVPKVTSE